MKVKKKTFERTYIWSERKEIPDIKKPSVTQDVKKQTLVLKKNMGEEKDPPPFSLSQYVDETEVNSCLKNLRMSSSTHSTRLIFL